MQQHQPIAQSVLDDLTSFRSELQRLAGNQYRELLQLTLWRPLTDVLMDWLVIAAMVVLVHQLGWWWAFCAVVVIGNRQRALGNVLHDAGHNSLHRYRKVNDALAAVLVAPWVFADLSAYRRAHFQHHMQLASGADPDKLPRLPMGSWAKHYLGHVFSTPLWWGSVLGHLGNPSVSAWRKLYIVGAWACLCWGIGWAVGTHVLVVFLSLWMLARAAAFHAITVFREMCDHYGLAEGGIVSYTRDIPKTSMWCHLVHPHNNGYHLTHHLLPAVPYYKLPQAQRLFALTPSYSKHGHVCDSYVFGSTPAVERWSLGD